MKDTGSLLRRYVEERSESAFAEVVQTYVDLVYSTAIRRTGGDASLAEDITQGVFIDLARKAPSLTGSTALGGWLYRHTCFRTAEAMRKERRRRLREQTAMSMKALDDDTESLWKRIAPFLDDAMDRLNTADRNALVLRFFERRDLRGVGEGLGTNEDAAQKRVSRALEKLRVSLLKRGVILPAGALATALGSQVVTSAPAGLAASLTGPALAHGSASAGIAFTFVKTMTLTKLKMVAMGGLIAAVVATTLVIQQQSLTRLREENRGLHELNQTLTRVHDQNDGSANRAQALSQEQLTELMRLRGQVALLRTQLKEKTTARNNTKPRDPTLWDPDQDPNVARAAFPENAAGSQPSTKFSARVPAGQTLLSGGWIREPGKRLFMLSTPSSMPNGNSILIDSRVMEVSDAVWEQLGWEKSRLVPQQAALDVLGVPETADLVNKLKTMPGVTILAVPRITTADFREARIATVGSGEGGNGRPETGRFLNIGVTPRHTETAEGSAFDLVFNVEHDRSSLGDASDKGESPALPAPQP